MEYKVISLHELVDKPYIHNCETPHEYLDRFLNEKAKDGWEFVGVISLGEQNCVIFKHEPDNKAKIQSDGGAEKKHA